MPRRSTPKHDVTIGFRLSSEPVRSAFQRRSFDALNRIAFHASTESLADALAAPTDVGALARILGDRAAIGPAVTALEPLAPLIARNAEHRLALLDSSGGTLAAQEAGALLGISRQAVDKRRRSHALLGLRQAGDWRYPRCQFADRSKETVAGLGKLLVAFAGSDPWVVLDFLLAKDAALGDRSPLDVLRTNGWTGELERLARGEQGDGFG